MTIGRPYLEAEAECLEQTKPNRAISIAASVGTGLYDACLWVHRRFDSSSCVIGCIIHQPQENAEEALVTSMGIKWLCCSCSWIIICHDWLAPIKYTPTETMYISFCTNIDCSSSMTPCNTSEWQPPVGGSPATEHSLNESKPPLLCPSTYPQGQHGKESHRSSRKFLLLLQTLANS